MPLSDSSQNRSNILSPNYARDDFLIFFFMKTRRFLFFLVFFSFLFLFCILKNSKNPENALIKTDPKKESKSEIISKSVLIGYANSDPIKILSAHRFGTEITVILASYGYLSRRLICRFFDSDKKEISNHPVTVFPEFTVRCHSEAVGSFYVALTINKRDKIEEIVKIEEEKPEKGTFFSVCLAPLWGSSPKWLHLIEFYEFYKIQGAEKFYIYVSDIDKSTEKVLEYYRNISEVIFIGNATKCTKKHRCRHEMQLQDCVTRTRSATTWVATVDLDERIFPINEDSRIIDLLRSPDKRTGEYRFRCQWTLRYSEVSEEPKMAELPMMTWHNTSHVAPENHTSKSIVRPIHVDSMGVHGVQKFQNGFRVQLIPPEVAVVRHYRLVKGWSFFLAEAETFGAFSQYFVSENVEKVLKNCAQIAIDRIFG